MNPYEFKREQGRYSFNLLSIFGLNNEDALNRLLCTDGCAILNYIDSTKRNKNGTSPLMVKVVFFSNQIKYSHLPTNDQSMRYGHLVTVQYIYDIMRWMGEPWMLKILKSVERQTPRSLETLCKASFHHWAPQESTLRRYLTPTHHLGRSLHWKGRLLDGDEYGDVFFSVLHGYHKSYRTMNTPFNTTLYTHQMWLHGKASMWMNFQTLGHLLLMEAILLDRHQWEEIYPDCFHCKIEMFHLYTWRHRWQGNVDYFIFLNNNMLMRIVPRGYFQLPHECLTERMEMLDHEIMWHNEFAQKFVKPRFFQIRQPLEVKRLDHLAELQLTANMFYKRAYELSGLVFKNRLYGVHDSIEFDIMEQEDWRYRRTLDVMCDFLRHTCNMGKTYTVKIKGIIFKYDVELKGDLIEKVIQKATCSPFLFNMSLMKMSSSFRQLGLPLMNELDCLAPDL